MRKTMFPLLLAAILVPAALSGQSVDFKGWHYPNAKSCDEAKKEFEAKYKTYGVLTQACKKKDPKGELGGVLSFSCFMGDGKNGFSGGAIITATVACNVPCIPPPSVCPADRPQVGTFASPGSPGWGKGTYAACLETPKPVTTSWCLAAYYPSADHKCDDYKGWSSVVSFGGKKYCVYDRTNSTYYKAVEIQDTPPPITVSQGGLHYPSITDCPTAIADYKKKFTQSAQLQSLCKAKDPKSVPFEILNIDCQPGKKVGFGGGTVLAVTVKCQ